MEKIIRWEIDYDLSIHCPFCGQMVLDAENSDFEACQHTLFIASDEGFEYRSEVFDRNVNWDAIDKDGFDMPEDGVDSLTDPVTIPGALKIAQYVGAPSGFGGYLSFAPTSDRTA